MEFKLKLTRGPHETVKHLAGALKSEKINLQFTIEYYKKGKIFKKKLSFFLTFAGLYGSSRGLHVCDPWVRVTLDFKPCHIRPSSEAIFM